MANRTRSKKRNTQRKNKKSKKMYMQRGGVFTQAEEDALLNQGGFNQQQVDFLNQNNVSFQNIQTATNYVLDNNQHTIAVFIASCLHNNPNQNNQNEIPQDLNIDDLQVDDDVDDVDDVDEAFIQGNNDGAAGAAGAADAADADDGAAADDDGDGNLGWNDQSNNQLGGKRKKTKKTRKGRKGRNSKKSRKMRGRKQRGGMRYGTGVGANCFEPNYSIYNTPALSLFPYKPN